MLARILLLSIRPTFAGTPAEEVRESLGFYVSDRAEVERIMARAEEEARGVVGRLEAHGHDGVGIEDAVYHNVADNLGEKVRQSRAGPLLPMSAEDIERTVIGYEASHAILRSGTMLEGRTGIPGSVSSRWKLDYPDRPGTGGSSDEHRASAFSSLGDYRGAGDPMAKSRPSVQKRRHEDARLEKRQLKAARKARRDAENDPREILDPDVDPDIAGIKPGPQPAPQE